MRLFEVEVEIAAHSTDRPSDAIFEQALDIVSGTLGEGDWGLHVGFTVGAVSYRQAVWRALEKVTNGARALGVSKKPVSLTVMTKDDHFRRLSERINEHPACPVGHDECPFDQPSA